MIENLPNDIIIYYIKLLVELLVKKDYTTIYNLDKRKTMLAEDMCESIEDYFEFQDNAELTYPPNEDYELFDLYQLEEPNSVGIEIYLWQTFDKNMAIKSDLTLGFKIIKENVKYDYSVQFIHVL